MEAVTNAYNNMKAALSTAPPSDAYLAWNAPGVEDIRPDEEETAKKIGVTMNKSNNTTSTSTATASAPHMSKRRAL